MASFLFGTLSFSIQKLHIDRKQQESYDRVIAFNKIRQNSTKSCL